MSRSLDFTACTRDCANGTSLTEQWKKGELEALDELIKQIEVIDNNRALSDEYLESKGLSTREGCNAVSEWSYGIVWVIVDYVLPYLKRVRELKEFADYSLHNRDELTRQINFWMDKHTKIEKENQQLKELLLDCSEFLYEILDGTRFKLSFKLESGIRKQYYMISLSELKTKIDNAIGEKK